MKFAPIEDTSRHQPAPGEDPSWQESFFLGWCDAENRCGGSHHVSLNPHLQLAHMWSWTVIDGKLAGRCQEHKLPLPKDDLRDITLAGHRFVAGASIRSLRFTAQYEDASLDLEYAGYHDPLEINVLRPQGRHYESMGRVTGSATVAGKTRPIKCTGWQDHSWGARNYSSTLSERWMFANFGEDLAFSLYSLNTSNGPKEFGYVLDAGELYLVRSVKVRVGVAADGLSPTDCSVIARTETGRAYKLEGEVQAAALTGGPGWSGTGSYFGMNGLTQFQCGGRLGEGILEISELKTLLPELRKELRIDPDATK